MRIAILRVTLYKFSLVEPVELCPFACYKRLFQVPGEYVLVLAYGFGYQISQLH
jgi:hypothetical protein